MTEAFGRPAFPAFCPHCKSIFPFRGIGIGEHSNVTLDLANIQAECPVCGYREAQISDGVFQANSSAIQVLSGPDSTHAIAAALKAIAERAAAGDISKAEAIKQANELSPKYGQLFENFFALGVPGLALLVAIIAMYLQYEGNQSSSADSLKLLNAITEQTFVLKNDHYEPRIQQKRTDPAGRKTAPKSLLPKGESTRRADVNRERRAALKKYREAFGQSRTR